MNCKDKNASCCHHNEGIKCDVKNCMYHAGDYYCTAEKINVGPMSAVTSADTVCSTFKAKAE